MGKRTHISDFTSSERDDEIAPHSHTTCSSYRLPALFKSANILLHLFVGNGASNSSDGTYLEEQHRRMLVADQEKFEH
jgi:hypothetical protein